MAGKISAIQNGTLVDGTGNSQRADIWFCDGQICAPAMGKKADWSFDASGMVVMPGGVDIHSHFAGPKVNAARRLNTRTRFWPEENHDTSRPFIPALASTGLCYAGLGYTTAFDAAVPPGYADQARLELSQLPCIDAGYFAMVGNHQSMLQAVADGDDDRVQAFLESTISGTGAYAAKLVNPGGVDDWKCGYRDGINSIDQTLQNYATTPRQIIRSLAEANDRLNHPHPIHVHCNRLGLPGNWQTTLETMQAVGDARCHLAHVQFHSYRLSLIHI